MMDCNRDRVDVVHPVRGRYVAGAVDGAGGRLPRRGGPVAPGQRALSWPVLLQHLARVLPDQGVAVLRYDRREAPGGKDVPYLVQVDDLAHGLRVLASELGPLPTGLWGFSQGAWVAMLCAATSPSLAFLALVGVRSAPASR